MDLILIAIIMGLIEGATEFLPVSSTGHLILTATLLDFEGERAKSFEIFIQLGAILAATLLYWRRYLGLFGLDKSKRQGSTPPAGTSPDVAAVGTRTRASRTAKRGNWITRLLVRGEGLNLIHVALGILPAGIVGLLIHDLVKEYLFSAHTVLYALVIGGLFVIFADKLSQKRGFTSETIDDLTYKQALGIGIFQCLALWPGFSRSGATISGGLLLGATKKAGADFSFMIAIPLMVGATGLDLIKSWEHFHAEDLAFFLTGFFTALVFALIAVFTFLKILQKVPWSAWAYYRFLVAGLFWFFILN